MFSVNYPPNVNHIVKTGSSCPIQGEIGVREVSRLKENCSACLVLSFTYIIFEDALPDIWRRAIFKGASGDLSSTTKIRIRSMLCNPSVNTCLCGKQETCEYR